MSRETLIDTIRNNYDPGFAAHITTAATVTEVGPQAAEPAAVANQICVFGGGYSNMELQVLCGTGGAQLDVRAWGWRFCPADSRWVPRLLVQFRTTARSVGATFMGATMYAPASHTININNANAIALDGSDTWKVGGCLQFDSRGSKFVSVGVHAVTGTPTANVLGASM